MKKLLLCLTIITLCNYAVAQKQVTIKGGTVVPVEAIKEVKATSVHVGQIVDLQVSRDVIVDGIVAIKAGTIVKSTVYEAKRSTAFGTKGRLGLRIKYLTLPSGDTVTFSSSDIYIQGKNRTAISVIVFCFTYLPFPCGSKAVLKPGIEYEAMVSANTTVTIE